MSQIKEVRDFLIKGYSLKTLNEVELSKEIEVVLANKKNNIFDIWLRAKGESLKTAGIPLSTPQNIYKKYLDEVTT